MIFVTQKHTTNDKKKVTKLIRIRQIRKYRVQITKNKVNNVKFALLMHVVIKVNFWTVVPHLRHFDSMSKSAVVKLIILLVKATSIYV